MKMFGCIESVACDRLFEHVMANSATVAFCGPTASRRPLAARQNWPSVDRCGTLGHLVGNLAGGRQIAGTDRQQPGPVQQGELPGERLLAVGCAEEPFHHFQFLFEV